MKGPDGYGYPTSPFKIWHFNSQTHDVPEQHEIKGSTGFEALKLGKGMEKKSRNET